MDERSGGLGRPFWTVWTAGSVSYLGDGLTIGAMPLLAASLTRDPRLISLVDALLAAGWLLLGLVSGVVVDRVDRLGLMWRVNALRTVLAGVFAGFVIVGDPSIGLIFGVSFLLGLASPFFDNAESSVLPDLVPEKDFERANSVNQLSLVLLANLLGPPAGAILFVVAAGAPFAVDAVSFAVAAVLVARAVTMMRQRAAVSAVPEPKTPGGGVGGDDGGGRRGAVAPAGMGDQLRDGLRFLREHPVLRTLAATVGVINMVVGGVIAILVLYCLEVLRLPQQAYGWLIACFGVGGIVGSLLTARLVARYGQGACALASTVVFGMTVLALGLAPDVAVVVPSLVLGGAASVLWNVVTISYRQRVVPRELLGRVTSVYRMVAFLAMPLGAAGAGWLAHATGIRRAYDAGGVLILLAALVAHRRMREMSGAVDGDG